MQPPRVSRSKADWTLGVFHPDRMQTLSSVVHPSATASMTGDKSPNPSTHARGFATGIEFRGFPKI